MNAASIFQFLSTLCTVYWDSFIAFKICKHSLPHDHSDRVARNSRVQVIQIFMKPKDTILDRSIHSPWKQYQSYQTTKIYTLTIEKRTLKVKDYFRNITPNDNRPLE